MIKSPCIVERLKTLHGNGLAFTELHCIYQNYIAFNVAMEYKKVFVFPGPWPFAWAPTLALAPALGPGPKFVFTGPGPQFVFTGPDPHLCLPQICIYRLSPMPEFAYTDLVSPICIYWPWPTICKHTGC